jgi:hypothetical protein
VASSCTVLLYSVQASAHAWHVQGASSISCMGSSIVAALVANLLVSRGLVLLHNLQAASLHVRPVQPRRFRSIHPRVDEVSSSASTRTTLRRPIRVKQSCCGRGLRVRRSFRRRSIRRRSPSRSTRGWHHRTGDGGVSQPATRLPLKFRRCRTRRRSRTTSSSRRSGPSRSRR